jgi:hypothetical protein
MIPEIWVAGAGAEASDAAIIAESLQQALAFAATLPAK